jgi:hypothetical protein
VKAQAAPYIRPAPAGLAHLHARRGHHHDGARAPLSVSAHAAASGTAAAVDTSLMFTLTPAAPPARGISVRGPGSGRARATGSPP